AVVVDGTGMPGDNALVDDTVQDNGGDGIQIDSTGNSVSGSTIKDNGGDGIQIAFGADSNQISDNKVIGNAHDGIDNSAFSTSIGGNQCKDNGGADIAGAGDDTRTVSHGGSQDNTVSDDSDIVT